MFEEDLKLYKYFDEQGKKITGYPNAGDVYWEYSNLGREFREEAGQERRGRPLFGHSPDFGYFYYGAIWYGDELWCGGRVKDYDGDGKTTELEVLRWNDEALGGKGFKNWEKFIHPQLGEVEIGGFNPKFFRQNPPPEYLEEWARKEALFNLLLAKSLPQVAISSVEAKPVKGEKDTYEIVCIFSNEGFLPTALEMAKRVKIVRPDRAVIELARDGVELIKGDRAIELGSLQSKEKREVRWRIKLTGKEGAQVKVSISSTRGGVQEKSVSLKK
jgi:hypothetical protein